MLNDRLGTQFPIIQAPMAGVQDSALAAAVCNAGGLGSLACAMLSPESLVREVASLTALTDQPFNLNFFCHTPTPAASEQHNAWQARLEPYYRELHIESTAPVPGPARQPFDHQMLAALRHIKPAVVSFHFGLPRADWVNEIKSWGTLVLSTATTAQEATWLADHGVDAIIAQGLEAGGHRGSFLTLDMTTQRGIVSLVPAIRAAVELPVIAAGGIAGEESVRAAVALGASAVQVGTAFLLCPEARTSQLHRNALQSRAAEHTAVTNVFTGRPARSIVNRLVREIGPMAATAPPFPWAAQAISTLRQAAEPAGNSDFTPMWCGQNTTGCRNLPAADIVQLLARGISP